MSMIDDLKTLGANHIAVAVLAFAALVAPGFLTIYHFKPELIEKYDVLKLVLFSLSLTLPLLGLNFVIFANFPSERQKALGEEKIGWLAAHGLMATIATGSAFYWALLLSYFLSYIFRYSVSRIFVLFLCGLIIFDAIVVFAAYRVTQRTPPESGA